MGGHIKSWFCQDWLIRRIFGLIFCLGLVSANTGLLAATLPASGISIEKITIAEERINAGRTQLVEVLVKNISYKSITGIVKLSLVLPNHNIVNFGNKRETFSSRSENRVLFPYPIEKSRGGDYTVGAKVYTLGGRVLAQNPDKEKVYFFAVDPTRKNQQPTRPIDKDASVKKKLEEKRQMETARQAVLFDPPDLAIEEISIVNNDSILRGETVHVRLAISNLGGDIAINSVYNVYWYFAPRENRKVKSYSDELKVIAPGERKIIDVPITIPEIEQKGEYYIYAAIDEQNLIKEINENNNTATSNKTIIFSDIALVFPDDMHSFAEDGLFKFQWRSRRYNQFKVQISADKLFTKYEDIFELPKGEGVEGWTPDDLIKPLPGEMPSMALALMESNGIDHLYWRVKAKNSEGNTTESTVRQFQISLKAELK